MTVLERTPEAVLDFWLSEMRSIADATGDNWRERMLMWRIGPFARSTENRRFLGVQREWCEQIHREGMDNFFADPMWETPRGTLAKIIVLDQFPRGVYRGTPTAYAYDAITGPLSCQVCDMEWDIRDYGIVERMWGYMPFSHAESLVLQERGVEKFIKWSEDLVAKVAPERRKINQFVSWSFIKATIEHSEVLLNYGRFPHRNAILRRPHKPGEPRYLNDPVRPLWTFTQPPKPDYFAILGALHRVSGTLDEDRIAPDTLASLQGDVPIAPDAPHSLMDVFDLTGGERVDYPTLYRHVLLPEKAEAFDALRTAPLIVDLMEKVKGIILKDSSETWPPKSAKHSVNPVIDVQALNAIVSGSAPPADA